MMMYELQPEMFILKRKKRNLRRLFLFRYFTDRALILFVVVLLTLLSLFFVTKAMAADDQPASVKTVTSVYIQPGDSLWSIAETFYTQECGDFQDYIEEIKRSNRLKDDTIHAGAYIIVPYYTTEQ